MDEKISEVGLPYPDVYKIYEVQKRLIENADNVLIKAAKNKFGVYVKTEEKHSYLISAKSQNLKIDIAIIEKLALLNYKYLYQGLGRLRLSTISDIIKGKNKENICLEKSLSQHCENTETRIRSVISFSDLRFVKSEIDEYLNSNGSISQTNNDLEAQKESIKSNVYSVMATCGAKGGMVSKYNKELQKHINHAYIISKTNNPKFPQELGTSFYLLLAL